MAFKRLFGKSKKSRGGSAGDHLESEEEEGRMEKKGHSLITILSHRFYCAREQTGK